MSPTNEWWIAKLRREVIDDAELTEGELKLLQWEWQGLNSKQIGNLLGIPGESPIALCIAPRGGDDEEMAAALRGFAPVNAVPAWVWWIDQGAMPSPPRQSRSMAVAERVS